MSPEPLLTEPWWDLRASGPDEARQREALHFELTAEVDPGHVLHGRSFVVVARSQAQDDILIAMEDGTWALVHVTWRGASETPPWPRTMIFDSLSEAIEASAPE